MLQPRGYPSKHAPVPYTFSLHSDVNGTRTALAIMAQVEYPLSPLGRRQAGKAVI